MTDALRPFRAPRLLIAASALALVLVTAGCGSSTSDASSPDTIAEADGSTTSTAVDGSTTTAADGGAGGEGEAEAGGEVECVADSNQPSGTSTVVWDDGEVAPELTMTFGDDGMLVPNTLTVAVGERFGVSVPAGSDLRVVKVGCAGGQSLPATITAGFVIDTAGTYVIVDEAANSYAGAEVGTVVVE